MERKATIIILFSILMLSAGASASIAEVEEIIDRPSDPLLQFGEWDLEVAVQKIHLDTMTPKERTVLLKKFHERASKHFAEKAISLPGRAREFLYGGAFLVSLFLTAKYAVKIAMPGRYGAIGQTFDSLRAGASLAGLIYSGKKFYESLHAQEALESAQRRKTYFEQMLERYQQNRTTH